MAVEVITFEPNSPPPVWGPREWIRLTGSVLLSIGGGVFVAFMTWLTWTVASSDQSNPPSAGDYLGAFSFTLIIGALFFVPAYYCGYNTAKWRRAQFRRHLGEIGSTYYSLLSDANIETAMAAMVRHGVTVTVADGDSTAPRVWFEAPTYRISPGGGATFGPGLRIKFVSDTAVDAMRDNGLVAWLESLRSTV